MLISESMPENTETKTGFYQSLEKVAPDKTIFTTNLSTTLPSDYAAFTGKPEKFLALHFANGIWDANIAEVMGHTGTSPEISTRVVKFASEISWVPIPICKEQNGYILNTLPPPTLNAAGDLLFNGVSDFESIDNTWMISMGAKIGPFGFMDLIGMQTMYNISFPWGNRPGDQSMPDRAATIEVEYIDKGKMGVSSGEGFYKNPNPSFEDPDFLKQ
jgi:3-hydroxyacyl-CoA dehydrogenase